MPTSQYHQINEIVELIIGTNPEKLLDIGVGFGKYGFLSREYLELWGTEHYTPDKWTRKIDGIEAFEKYTTQVHDYIYNKIYIGNAIDILPTLDERYDLILLIDVLEHFDYDEGVKILQECEKHGRNILISVPMHIGSQKDRFGNPYETHKFQWERSHFNTFNSKFILPNIGGSLIVYIGEKAQEMKALWKKRRSLLKIIVVRILDVVHLKELIKRLFNK